jgi:hypothetical protein
MMHGGPLKIVTLPSPTCYARQMVGDFADELMLKVLRTLNETQARWYLHGTGRAQKDA